MPFDGSVFFEEAVVPDADFIFAVVEVVDGAVIDVEDGVAVGEEAQGEGGFFALEVHVWVVGDVLDHGPWSEEKAC